MSDRFWARGQTTRPPGWGLSVGLTTLPRKKILWLWKLKLKNDGGFDWMLYMPYRHQRGLKQAAHSPPTHVASSGFWRQLKMRLAVWCATPCGKMHFLPRLAASISNRFDIMRRWLRLAARGSTPATSVLNTRQDLASKTAWCRVSWQRVCCRLK
jgi:hypothetical protein